MLSKSSENDFLRSLGKLLDSPRYQPKSIAAGADDPALLTVQNTGSAAVDDCIKAYNAAFSKKLDKTKNEYSAHKSGSDAYRQAIPALLGSCNMADFIACVTHGLVLGAIQGNDASRLIYAAQVANSTMPQSARRPGRPSAQSSDEPIYKYAPGTEPWRVPPHNVPDTRFQPAAEPPAPEHKNPAVNE